MNYYNEWDKKTAAWLRELIKAGLIPKGEVDERSITDVQPGDLRGFAQCHFFAGIGGWSYALKLANWPEYIPVWTGSCPCQPWSNANTWQGGGRGAQDSRHLWPAWFRLIQECKPTTVLGEQVPGAIQKGWLDVAFTDLESINYACGAVVVPAHAVGSRHKRLRLWFVADAGSQRWEGYKQIESFSSIGEETRTITIDPFVGAKRALDGDYSDLLPCDGLSVVVERDAIKGYGNAIVPQVAAQFIQAYLETLEL